ncbi:hypothetical protein QAD02_023974 [Eretmocerus hayati]|uniref:Uncharacterized protein n=1 Tax=Eretmocerus hayati TaxID=131215 RepID=A0ACC2PX29_9HYME|nr:hypothetical protein QAD02_023974 [Eretmocerus hayati]
MEGLYVEGDSYGGGGGDYSSSYNEPSQPSYSSYNDTPSCTEPQSHFERSETSWDYSGPHSSDPKNAEQSEDPRDRPSFFENIRSFFGGSSDPEPPSRDLQPPLEDSREFTTRASEESTNCSDQLRSRDYLRSLLRDPLDQIRDGPLRGSESVENYPECKMAEDGDCHHHYHRYYHCNNLPRYPVKRSSNDRRKKIFKASYVQQPTGIFIKSVFHTSFIYQRSHGKNVFYEFPI